MPNRTLARSFPHFLRWYILIYLYLKLSNSLLFKRNAEPKFGVVLSTYLSHFVSASDCFHSSFPYSSRWHFAGNGWVGMRRTNVAIGTRSTWPILRRKEMWTKCMLYTKSAGKNASLEWEQKPSTVVDEHAKSLACKMKQHCLNGLIEKRLELQSEALWKKVRRLRICIRFNQEVHATPSCWIPWRNNNVESSSHSKLWRKLWLSQMTSPTIQLLACRFVMFVLDCLDWWRRERSNAPLMDLWLLETYNAGVWALF